MKRGEERRREEKRREERRREEKRGEERRRDLKRFEERRREEKRGERGARRGEVPGVPENRKRVSVAMFGALGAPLSLPLLFRLTAPERADFP